MELDSHIQNYVVLNSILSIDRRNRLLLELGPRQAGSDSITGMEGISRPAPQVGAAKSSLAPVPPTTTIRRYTPAQDRAAVFDICRDVYDGRDYIPRVIDDYADETDVLVECSEASGEIGRASCRERV